MLASRLNKRPSTRARSDNPIRSSSSHQPNRHPYLHPAPPLFLSANPTTTTTSSASSTFKSFPKTPTARRSSRLPPPDSDLTGSYQDPPLPLLPRRNAHRRHGKIYLTSDSLILDLQHEHQTQQQQQQPSINTTSSNDDAVSFHPPPLQRSKKLVQVYSSSPLATLQRSISLKAPAPASPSPTKKNKVLEVVASLSPMKLVRRSKTGAMKKALQEKEVVLESVLGGVDICRKCEVEHAYGSCAATGRVCAWRKGIEEELDDAHRYFTQALLSASTSPARRLQDGRLQTRPPLLPPILPLRLVSRGRSAYLVRTTTATTIPPRPTTPPSPTWPPRSSTESNNTLILAHEQSLRSPTLPAPPPSPSPASLIPRLPGAFPLCLENATVLLRRQQALASFASAASLARTSASSLSSRNQRIPGSFPLDARPASQDTGFASVLSSGEFTISDRRKRRGRRTPWSRSNEDLNVEQQQEEENVVVAAEVESSSLSPPLPPHPSPLVEGNSFDVEERARTMREGRDLFPSSTQLRLDVSESQQTVDELGSPSPSSSPLPTTTDQRPALTFPRRFTSTFLTQSLSISFSRVKSFSTKFNPRNSLLLNHSSSRRAPLLSASTSRLRPKGTTEMSSLVVEQILLRTSHGGPSTVGGGRVGGEGGREGELTLEDLEFAMNSSSPFPDNHDEQRDQGLDTSLVVSVMEDLSPKPIVVLLPAVPPPPPPPTLAAIVNGSRFVEETVPGACDSLCPYCTDYPPLRHAHTDSEIGLKGGAKVREWVGTVKVKTDLVRSSLLLFSFLFFSFLSS